MRIVKKDLEKLTVIEKREIEFLKQDTVDSAYAKTVLVVDSNGIFQGIITPGDFRRSCGRTEINRNCLRVKKKAALFEVEMLFGKNPTVRLIPVVDDCGVLLYGYEKKGGMQFAVSGNYDLIRATNHIQFDTVLDVGLGNGSASLYFAKRGKRVTAIGLSVESYGIDKEELSKAGVEMQQTAFETFHSKEKFDAIWMSHVLEHTSNVGFFLEKAKNLLKEDGWLFVMVPPYKPEVVIGHLTNGWKIGQLMYNLLASGFSIKQGHFIKHGYNICGFVQSEKKKITQKNLNLNDSETRRLWPIEVHSGFNGDLEQVNWEFSL